MTPWALNPDLEIHPFDLVTLVKTKNSGRLLNDTFSVFRQNIKKNSFWNRTIRQRTTSTEALFKGLERLPVRDAKS